MASSEFRPLDEKSLVEYIRATPSLLSLLDGRVDDLTIKEVGDGNLNLVFIVVSRHGGSVVIKQVNQSMPSPGSALGFVSLFSQLLFPSWLDSALGKEREFVANPRSWVQVAEPEIELQSRCEATESETIHHLAASSKLDLGV
ncbi:hypothetical protein ACLOJK_000671 [Asimina triloba]